jgi:acetyl esterase/lipase
MAPKSDVKNGYLWARNQLPALLLKQGIKVDGDRVVAVGWSTGGHLAMTLGWTTKESGAPPPIGILSFYASVNFENGGMCFMALQVFRHRQLTAKIRTGYACSKIGAFATAKQ